VGTEHVLLALLSDPESVTARAVGVDIVTARDALRALDERALLAVGVSAGCPGPVFPGRVGERLPLTPAAKGVFTGLRRAAQGERLGVHHVLLTLLGGEHPDPAADLLDSLAVNRTAVRDRLQALR
jgi:hypothetical protein